MGHFPGPVMNAPYRPWALLNWLFWVCLLVYPLCIIALRLLSGSTFTVLSTFFFCIAGIWVNNWGGWFIFSIVITIKHRDIYYWGRKRNYLLLLQYFHSICFSKNLNKRRPVWCYDSKYINHFYLHLMHGARFINACIFMLFLCFPHLKCHCMRERV